MKVNDKAAIALDGHSHHAQTVTIEAIYEESGLAKVQPDGGEPFEIATQYLIVESIPPVPPAPPESLKAAPVYVSGQMVTVHMEGHEIDGLLAEVREVAPLLVTVRRSDVDYILSKDNIEPA